MHMSPNLLVNTILLTSLWFDIHPVWFTWDDSYLTHFPHLLDRFRGTQIEKKYVKSGSKYFWYLTLTSSKRIFTSLWKKHNGFVNCLFGNLETHIGIRNHLFCLSIQHSIHWHCVYNFIRLSRYILTNSVANGCSIMLHSE